MGEAKLSAPYHRVLFPWKELLPLIMTRVLNERPELSGQELEMAVAIIPGQGLQLDILPDFGRHADHEDGSP